MTLEARSGSVPSLGLVKMEDTRKRTVPADPDEALPPPKRQATLVNGNKSEPFADWDPNMEVRQMSKAVQTLVQHRHEDMEAQSSSQTCLRSWQTK